MGLAGALIGQPARKVTPHQLHWLFSAKLVLTMVFGGTQHSYGPDPVSLSWGSLMNRLAWAVGRYMTFGCCSYSLCSFLRIASLVASALRLVRANRSRIYQVANG